MSTFPFESVLFLSLFVACAWCFILAFVKEDHKFGWAIAGTICGFFVICISIANVNERAYQQGKQAAAMKIEPNANPYVSDTMAGPKWLEGYMDTMKSQQ